MKAIIEIPMGSKYKYEIKDGQLFLDRTMNVSVPVNYGFIPYTLAPDGDALDIFVSSFHPIGPFTNAKAMVVGVYECLDQGVRDDKVVAVLEGEDVAARAADILKYLTTYKTGFEVIGYQGPDMAYSLIERAQNAYAKSVDGNSGK